MTRTVFSSLFVSLLIASAALAQKEGDGEKPRVRTVSIPISIFTKDELRSGRTEEFMRHLPLEVVQSETSTSDVPKIPGSSLAEIERYAILETLAMVGGSTTAAARTLGISVRKIQSRLQEYAEAPKSKAPALRSVR